ncbi:hypothetical protein DSECCO2_612320 [anaerobic digester metagenome]
METIEKLFKQVKSAYDQDQNPIDGVADVVATCIDKLNESNKRLQSKANDKEYWVFYEGGNISRPYLPGMLVLDKQTFSLAWTSMVKSINPGTGLIDMDTESVNKTIYTGIMSFALVYDLWKPTSRKTPGTFFEVILGSIMSAMLPGHTKTKHIILPGQVENVSTDIVFQPKDGGSSIVIPAKITTRERIVQPFAHQRILDSVFGEGKYKSILVCVSETQRNEDSGVNDICVPGTVRLFQSHLAKMYGIYYLDPPSRYLKEDIIEVIKVGSLAEFLTKDIANFI